MKDYEDLRIWKEAHLMALDIYRTTFKFPKEELYGLTSQLRRAVLSIPTNIAEGVGRDSDKDLARFLIISRGSIMETRYLLFFAKDMKLIKAEYYLEISDKLNRLKTGINGFIKKLKSV